MLACPRLPHGSCSYPRSFCLSVGATAGMTKKNAWMKNLLRSSLPLEFEAAKLLVKAGFGVQAEFPYTRLDKGVRKEFSVDILARCFLDKDGEVTQDAGLAVAVLLLLVECKHRFPGTHWLCLPDPNERDEQSDFALGSVVHVIDSLSDRSVEPTHAHGFEQQVPGAYRAIEIGPGGEVFDSKIREGVAQLQYALPVLLAQQLHQCLARRHVLAYCPVLLTTAELVLARRDLTLAKVDEAEAVPRLGDPVPATRIIRGCGPELVRHSEASTRLLEKLHMQREVQDLDRLRATCFRDADRPRKELDGTAQDPSSLRLNYSASRLILGLHQAHPTYLGRFFTQFAFCELCGLVDFATGVRRSVGRCIREAVVYDQPVH